MMDRCYLKHGRWHLYWWRKKLAVFSVIVVSIISLQELWGKRQLAEPLMQDVKNSTGTFDMKCPNGSFILKGMNKCHLWLNCSDIKKDLIFTNKTLGVGAEKLVKEGVWQGHSVAVSLLLREKFLSDFRHNLDMLQIFNKEPGAKLNKVVQLIGWCFEDNPLMITEMHPFGSANHVHLILRKHFSSLDTLKLKFRLCIDFVQILRIIHTHPDGPRVFCDANDPLKALSQLLLTSDLTLILNDMDAMPLVNRAKGQLVKCGSKELHGDFVAPEQLWPHDSLNFQNELMPGYDEKIDIWKIPDVCNAVMGKTAGMSNLQLRLFNIHSQCKQLIPHHRPTATEVLNIYENIYEKL